MAMYTEIVNNKKKQKQENIISQKPAFSILTIRKLLIRKIVNNFYTIYTTDAGNNINQPQFKRSTRK